jgi:O-antigen/teichoic acid export membrane protein
MLNNTLSRVMNISPVQRQSMISLFWQIAFTAIGFLSTMYFAHAVGAAILGAYFLFTAYQSIFSMVSDGGFGGAALKRISEGEEPDAFFSAYFVLRLAFTGIVILFLIIFKPYFVDLNTSGLFFLLIAALVFSLFDGPISAGVAGTGKMGIRTTCAGIGNIAKILFQVIAIFLGYEAGGLVVGAIAGTLVAAIIEFHFFELHFVTFTWEHIKSLSVFSFWLFMTSGGVLVYSQADVIMIGYFLNNADVGVYRIALQFTTIATFTTYALRTTLWPKVSKWGKSGDTMLVEESLSQALSYSLLLAIPVMVGGILLGDRLLYLFYGEEFKKGYYVLIILLAVQVVNVFQFFFTMYLDALDHPKESFKVTFVSATGNILLNLLFIPDYGITGAAIATLLSMILNVILARRPLMKLMNIKIKYDSLKNILVASLIMGVFVGIYRTYVPLSNIMIALFPVLIGGIIFCIVLMKIDHEIYNEIKNIALKMEFPWPYWM